MSKADTMSEYTSLKHAEHNKEVCLLLTREAKYDWAVVTAFYSSIHFLYHYLFPMDVTQGSRVVRVDSFLHYCKLQKLTNDIGKHELLGKAVKSSGLSSQVRNSYERLKESSFHARYNNMLHERRHADQAAASLDIVKKGCESLSQQNEA
jgi:hypothetical protein